MAAYLAKTAAALREFALGLPGAVDTGVVDGPARDEPVVDGLSDDDGPESGATAFDNTKGGIIIELVQQRQRLHAPPARQAG